MDIQKHPHIPKHIFITILNTLTAIDNILSLHYSTHTTHPHLNKVLMQASSYIKSRIGMNDLNSILGIDSSMYTLFRLDDDVIIKFPVGVQLLLRKQQFIKSLNTWIESHPDCKEVPKKSSIVSSSSSSSPSPKKIIKPRSASSSPTKKKFHDLRNEASRFKFTERIEADESVKCQGLSLLERIRLKERLKKEQEGGEDSKERKYESYLVAKVPMIYDAIYQVYYSQPDTCKSFSTKKLIQIIQDSSSYPVIAEEIHDGMKLIESKLSQIRMIEKDGVQVIRVSSLNRDQDLQILNG